MTVVLACLLVLLIGCFILSRNHPSLARGVGAAAAVAGLGCGVFALLRGGEDNVYDISIEEACGVMLGGEMRKRIPGGGKVLVLRYPESASPTARMSTSRFKGLQKTAGPEFTFVHAGPAGAKPSPGFIPIDLSRTWRDIKALYASQPDLKAVVSLLPLLENITGSNLEGLPPLYCFVIGREDLGSLLADGRIHAAIGYREFTGRPREPPGKKAGPAAQFNYRYKLFTSEGVR